MRVLNSMFACLALTAAVAHAGPSDRNGGASSLPATGDIAVQLDGPEGPKTIAIPATQWFCITGDAERARYLFVSSDFGADIAKGLAALAETDKRCEEAKKADAQTR